MHWQKVKNYMANVFCYVDDDVIIPVSWYNMDEHSKSISVRRFQDLSDTGTDKMHHLK